MPAWKETLLREARPATHGPTCSKSPEKFQKLNTIKQNKRMRLEGNCDLLSKIEATGPFNDGYEDSLGVLR